MKYGLYFLLIWLGLMLLSALSSQAQTPDTCPTLYADTLPGVIQFIEPSTGEVVHEDTVPHPFHIDHSPDCRWLVGYTTQYFGIFSGERCEPGVIIWDAQTGSRIRQFDDMCDTSIDGFPKLIWKPDNSILLLTRWHNFNDYGSVSPRYFWYPHNNQAVEIPFTWSKWTTLNPFEWDDQRQLIWSSGAGDVGAISYVTGKLVYWFPNGNTYSTFVLSPDTTKVVAKGHYRDRSYNSANMSVHDIATGNSIVLNVETNGLGAVAMSLDNRYVGMAYTAIRVWDLQNLDDDHLPNYRFYFPDSDIAEWEFIDSTTIEATSKAGEVMRWSLETGQPIEP